MATGLNSTIAQESIKKKFIKSKNFIILNGMLFLMQI